ncbi:MAG: hypothetical protein Q7R34_11980 [Dehalococcoidia bacterium]|nr:hypothetical protein [Dehalococcoidia bacterium]
MPDLGDLIVQLSDVRVGQRDRGRTVNVAGHLIHSVLNERWLKLSDNDQKRLTAASAKRLRGNYETKLKYSTQPTREAAEQAISEELELLQQMFNPVQEAANFTN